MTRRPHVLVVGAGVSGLTAAVCLAEAGLPVLIRSLDPPAQTSSCSAGAIWGPYLVADRRVLTWAEQTRLEFTELAADPDTGIRVVYGLEASRSGAGPPDWARRMDRFRVARPDELPPGFISGWWYAAPVINMPKYLAYLSGRLAQAGGVIEVGAVDSLAEALDIAPLVVNCAGVWASRLAPDPKLAPTRGQLVVVEDPGVREFFVEYDESPTPTYVLPQGDHVVLGGSAEPGRTDLVPDTAVSAAIQRRCALVEPRLANARVLSHRVGLRPSRPRVRLERVGQVIHNYGHGGAGVTLSWGCAREVLELSRSG
jgi:D-amino-acid oxidase